MSMTGQMIRPNEVKENGWYWLAYAGDSEWSIEDIEISSVDGCVESSYEILHDPQKPEDDLNYFLIGPIQPPVVPVPTEVPGAVKVFQLAPPALQIKKLI